MCRILKDIVVPLMLYGSGPWVMDVKERREVGVKLEMSKEASYES